MAQSRLFRPGSALVACLAVACSSACNGGGNLRTPASGGTHRNGAEAVALRAAFAVPAFAAERPRAPISLTASDGSGLAMRSLEAHTRIHGPIAETEIRMRFYNPEPRQREGRFRIALPPRAFVSRLAMKIDGKLVEADVAELARAREVYEEILHRRRDPLLVEQHGTNELSARVFPIPASSEKEIVLGYIAEVGAEAPATIPLAGLPAIDSLSVRVTQGEETLFAWTDSGIAPARDVRIEPTAHAPSAVRVGDLVVARVKVPELAPSAGASGIGRGLVVLLDTSASRASGLETDLARLRALVVRLAAENPSATLSVAAFDQGVMPAYRGTMAGFDDAAIARLRARGALGASDIEGALAWAAGEARAQAASRVLLVSDGLATGGASEVSRLRAATRALGDAGVERVDAIAVGEVRAEATLHALTTGEVQIPGSVIDGASPSADDAARIASRLERSVLATTAVAAPGATHVWPRAIVGAQPGDEVNVVVETPHGAEARITVGGRAVPIATTAIAGASATFEKVAARATIEALVDASEREGWTDARRAKVIAIAKAKKVASPLTSFIVLESDADRAALDVPATVKKAVAKAARPRAAAPDLFAPAPPAQPKAAPAPVTQRTGAHVTKAPMLRMAATMVTGRLPAETIQLVVRQNFGRFRACYEEGLRRRGPKLGGRVVTKFVIGRDGSVLRSESAGSEIGDDTVESCIANAFSTLSFAQPEGGIVTVVYPIVLQPPGSEEEEPTPFLPSASVFRPHHAEPYAAPLLLPWSGDYQAMHRALDRAQHAEAIRIAAAARAHDPNDVVALVALGEALVAAELPDLAQRAFGSLADLRPNDAEALRAAAVRLEQAAGAPTALSIELLRRAVGDRPDHPHGHHELAMALVRMGDLAGAFEALAEALGLTYAPRYARSTLLLRHELRVVAAAWIAAEPLREDAITKRLASLVPATPTPDATPSETFAVSWETDASDAGFASLPGAEHLSWGNDGYGPDAWVLPGERAARPAMPLVVSYRRRGPTGYLFGVVHVMEHDGRGHLSVEPRPFVVMNEGADVNVGVY